jgi:hypothetical protein
VGDDRILFLVCLLNFKSPWYVGDELDRVGGRVRSSIRNIPNPGDPKGSRPHLCNPPSLGRVGGWELFKAGDMVPSRVSQELHCRGSGEDDGVWSHPLGLERLWM